MSLTDECCVTCASLPHATVDNAFGEQTNVYRIGQKMFALVNVDPGDLVTLKVIPEDGEALRKTHSCITPGYYMDKRHWISINLTEAAASELPAGLLDELLEDSYRLVRDSLPRSVKNALI